MSDSNVRTFGDFEQKIIKEIKKLNDEGCCVTPPNILSELDEFGAKFAFDDSDGFRVTYREKLDFASEKDKKFVKDTERNLCDFVLLMEYLIKEEYLFEIKGKNQAETSQNNKVLNNLEKRCKNLDMNKRFLLMTELQIN